MLRKFQDNPILALSLLTLIMLGFNLDVIPVSIMEARNFITAREMITDGNWLLTTLNGEARYQKPPLPSWICALFGLVFGIKSVVAMRLPALIFIAITANYTYLLSKKLTNYKSQSFNNGLILLTSFYVIAIAFEASSDIFTHGFMMMGIYHLFSLFEEHQDFAGRALLAGLFIGFSILSKGPVSFYVLLFPFLLAYGFSFRYRFSKKLILAFLGCIIFSLIIGGSWYLYVRLEDPVTLLTVAETETGNWSSYNVRPFYYYWSFFVQSGIWSIPAVIGLLYPYMKTRVANLKAYKFSFFWTVFAVVLLSIIPEKKSRYLMPVLIPLAINTGFYIEYVINNFKSLQDKRELAPIYVHFGLIATIAIALPFALFSLLDGIINMYLWNYILLSFVVIAIGLTILIQLRKKKANSLFYLNVLFFMVILLFGLPVSEAFKSDSYEPISELNKTFQSKNLTIYALDAVAPEMLWDYGGKITQLRIANGIKFPKEKKFGLLTNEISPEDLDLLQAHYSIKKVGQFNLNSSGKNSRGYKTRLQNDFYILTKKD